MLINPLCSLAGFQQIRRSKNPFPPCLTAETQVKVSTFALIDDPKCVILSNNVPNTFHISRGIT